MKAIIIDASSAYSSVISALHGTCFDESWNEKAIADTLSMPGAAGLIIGSDSETPQGFLLFRLAADEAEILSIGIIESARRTGLAGLLLRSALEHARQKGATRMFLEVAEDNAAAGAFYENAGFKMVGRRTAYYSRPKGKTDALIYKLEITRK